VSSLELGTVLTEVEFSWYWNVGLGQSLASTKLPENRLPEYCETH